MNRSYVALVGDLIGSRKITQRESFDAKMLCRLNEMSKTNEEIISPYTLIGDEIQAVYINTKNIFRDSIEILASIYPHKMRLSFGIGKLIKEINTERATEMDGPAFYYARDGVNELKLNKEILSIRGDNILYQDLILETLKLVSKSLRSWNETRLWTLAHLQKGCSIKDIAILLKKTDQAIYKTISEGNLETVQKIFVEITEILHID